MPEVESKNYAGKDRRNGNGRLRLSTQDWIYVGTLFIGLILAWGNMRFTTDANAKQIIRNTLLVDTHQIKIAVLENSINNIEKDIGEIKTILMGKRETWGTKGYISADKSGLIKVQ